MPYPLTTQQRLRQHGLDRFIADHAVKIKRHTVHPNLVLFKYNRDADWSDTVLHECRGLILDESDNWAVVAHPFNKFFNYNEPQGRPIDWATAKVYPKLDGSLMTLYYYKSGWWCSTSGVPDAMCPVNNDESLTFDELFWESFYAARLQSQYTSYTTRGLLSVRHCYYFELTSPLNRVVVPYPDNRLTLLGVRNLDTGQELDPGDIGRELGLPHVQPLALRDIETVIEQASHITPNEGEGYVVCDAAFNRIKIKSPAYLSVAKRLNGQMNQRAMLQLILTGEVNEFIGYFPEFRDLYGETIGVLTRFKAKIQSTYGSIQDIKSQKEFAERATQYRYSTFLFALRKRKEESAPTVIDDLLHRISFDKVCCFCLEV